MLFHCMDPRVKRLMGLTPLLTTFINYFISQKADFVLMIGDFNAKSCNWSINDTTTPEGAQLDSITSLYGMKQLIPEPTHILQ